MNNILLTGATGFLGSHLLYDLYKYTNAQIYCVIRKSNNMKLQNSLKKYNLCIKDFSRIIVVEGDLQDRYLGINKEQYVFLSHKVDTIFHNGAMVHHLYDYEMVKKTNVNSTKELIKFAFLNKKKAIVYISTLSAINELDKENYIIENFPSNNHYGLIGGYNQSKWVSEVLLRQAKERNIKVVIFRPGFITGNSNSGICTPKNDHFLNFLKSCIQMGCAPNLKTSINFLPVDFVSKFIVHVSLHSSLYNKVFNLSNPMLISWDECINILNKLGYYMSIVPVHDWKEYLLSKIDPKNALYPFASLYCSKTINNNVIYKIRNKNTQKAINQLDIRWPKLDINLFKIYFQFLRKINFILENDVTSHINIKNT